jgi:predicted DNA-binding transcriptional regulator AlpA
MIRNQTAEAVAALRPKAAAQYLGMGESTLWRLAKDDPKFPKGRKITPRLTVFVRTELDDYLASLSCAAA